jgi:nucleotidyltransferase AbiEii toxin of type IV toxin-antitoxin system
MTAPSRATIAGQAYLDLRRKARQDRRPVDELIQLYVLEGFLARLAQTPFAERFVLKGGMLLAALGERRPTRDIDLQADTTSSDTGTILTAVRQIAGTPLPDGVVFDLETAAAREVRDEDSYPGVRVTMTARLATARAHFHVDVSAGDPITPPARQVRIPRLLGGVITARGYPLAMVYSEKIVTAVARGTVNTRWRDFADIYLLTRRHPVDGAELCRSVHDVARHRRVDLRPLAEVLHGYGDIGQQRWAAWRAKQQLSDRLPEQFRDVVASATDFADPTITANASGHSWDPGSGTWS